jgi:hypothetical protein
VPFSNRSLQSFFNDLHSLKKLRASFKSRKSLLPPFKMRFFRNKPTEEVAQKGTPNSTTPAETPARRTSDVPQADGLGGIPQPQGRVPAVAVTLGAVASIGGFMFGYESGQISGICLIASPSSPQTLMQK